MWGDPERALNLDASDSLSMLLFQIASPAHIPWNDPRYDELLHGFNVWVHVEARDGGVVASACEKMSKHAANSSNLAALGRLVCQMFDELNPQGQNGSASQQHDQVAAFSERISIVGKARAAAGALQLLRIFVHRVLVDFADQESVLNEIFTYRNRDFNEEDVNVARDLLDSLFGFLTSGRTSRVILEIPEMYDTAVLALQLLLVMLSTQLYKPMVSSFQQIQQPERIQSDFFLDIIMEHARELKREGLGKLLKVNDPATGGASVKSGGVSSHRQWTPKSVLSACLVWQMQRPGSPDRSIVKYHQELARSVVAAKGEKVGPDGMYESNLVVTAAAPKTKHANEMGESSGNIQTHNQSQHHQSFLLDATKGVLVHASSIILLPFRLVSLALGLWGNKQKGFDQSRKTQFDSSMLGASRTRDILWITESPIADLASAVLLLLTNNRRAVASTKTSAVAVDSEGNPFRIELSRLADNRWESGHDSSALPDLPVNLGQHEMLNESLSLLDSFDRGNLQEALPGSSSVDARKNALMVNFETLFLSFGATLHTEISALSLYTLLQSSRAFSETVASRSDLDTLVLPLLRTLYFSSSTRHASALDFHYKSLATKNDENASLGTKSAEKSKSKASVAGSLSILTCPFRSQSQLYLIVILLLLFSQDSSFGSDAFRRTMVPAVPWYKERYLKDISLGSVMLLTLMRSLTFNLNRLHDIFLLSNCCAVLMNLSHAVVDLHEYAAMRLASVTVSCLKKYSTMASEDALQEDVDDGGVSIYEMYAEVSHTLLRLIKHALAPKLIDRNLHLVYALVYHQADFKKVFGMKKSPFKKSEINRTYNVIKASSKIIETQSNARTATKALQVLAENMDQIQEAVAEKKKKNTEKEDFAFTYEEESDPEIFFIPYIWEVVVCAITATSVEWCKNSILVFPLLDIAEEEEGNAPSISEPVPPSVFASDVMDVV